MALVGANYLVDDTRIVWEELFLALGGDGREKYTLKPQMASPFDLLLEKLNPHLDGLFDLAYKSMQQNF